MLERRFLREWEWGRGRGRGEYGQNALYACRKLWKSEGKNT